jgi:hypothetical protein
MRRGEDERMGVSKSEVRGWMNEGWGGDGGGGIERGRERERERERERIVE